MVMLHLIMTNRPTSFPETCCCHRRGLAALPALSQLAPQRRHRLQAWGAGCKAYAFLQGRRSRRSSSSNAGDTQGKRELPC